MVSSLLLQLARGIWAIEPTAAEAYYPVVRALILGEKIDYSQLVPKANFGNTDKPYGEWKRDAAIYQRETNVMALQAAELNAYSPSYSYGFDRAPKNSVALIPMHGAVMKYDYCGEAGTSTLARWVQEADNHPNIVGTILSIDSPGGAANGTQDFSRVILNTQKPIVAFTHGMMCSAAYWIGSSAKKIIASNETVMVGSIGTYLTLEDWSTRLEQDGIKVHEIYATKSTQKNALVHEAFAGNYNPIRQQMIDPINEAFLSAVRKNRYGKKLNADKTLKGATFMGTSAIEVGLIDQIGTLKDAVLEVQKLAKA